MTTVGSTGSRSARRWPLVGGALLLWLAPACDQAPPPDAVARIAELPKEPVALTAELRAGWEDRGELASRAQRDALAQAAALGLSRVEDLEVAVTCERKRCTGQVTATALP